MNKMLDVMLRDIIVRLSQEPTDNQAQRAIRLGAAISQIVQVHADDISEQTIQAMIALAEDEAEFTQKALGQVVAAETVIPTAEQIAAVATQKPMRVTAGKVIRELTMQDAFKQFSEKKAGEIRRIVQSGFISGTTTQELTREVERVVKTRTKQQAEALVRTTVNHMSNVARNETMQQNSDVIIAVKWSSVLDGRTSLVCAGRDGTQYPIDSGPRPPAHFNCRSTTAPIINPRFVIPGVKRSRASMDGQVSGKTTYNSWLKKQSTEFQDEVLGVEKAKLFRSGGLSIDKFTDDRGIMYSRAQLKQLNPLAFERAGLD